MAMVAAAERMKTMRDRRRARGMREIRIIVPDSRLDSVRLRIAAQVAGLNPRDEQEGLAWVEAVSEFDEPHSHGGDAAR
jgi:hypothetical protein